MYTHRFVLFSTLVRKGSFLFQWVVICAETYNWSKYWTWIALSTYVCESTLSTFHHWRLMELHTQEHRKNISSQWMGEEQWNATFLTCHKCCMQQFTAAVVTYIRSSQSKFQCGWRRGPMILFGDWWMLREKHCSLGMWPLVGW